MGSPRPRSESHAYARACVAFAKDDSFAPNLKRTSRTLADAYTLPPLIGGGEGGRSLNPKSNDSGWMGWDSTHPSIPPYLLRRGG